MDADLAGKLFSAAVVGYMLYRFVRYGGFTGFAVGARVQATVGEVKGAGGPFWRVRLKVQSLCIGDPDKVVALQFKSRGLGESSVSAISLSADEARQLAALIRSAAKGRK